jgi:hypothetical protein
MRFDGTREVRRFTGVVVPAVAAALGVLPWLVLAHDLPHRAAAHFNWRGHPNGALPLPVLAVVLGGVTVACSAVLVGWTWSSLGDRANRVTGFLAAFTGMFFGLLSLCTALANKGHASWHDARLQPGAVGGSFGAAFGVAMAFVAITAVQDAAPDAHRPTLPLAADERAAWFGRASNRRLSTLGGIMVVVALGLVVAGLYGAASGIGVGGLAVLGASSVRVAVSERGVVVSSGPLGWPSVRFALDDVVSAGSIDFKPLQWGGWGYRGSLHLFRKAAWGLRRGPAIELELRRGRRFAVTVDDADAAAAVINGLVAHRPVY